MAEGEGKYVRMQTMKAYRESRFVAAFILNFSTQWRWLVRFMLWPFYPWNGGGTREPLNRGTGSALGQVRTFFFWGGGICSPY